MLYSIEIIYISMDFGVLYIIQLNWINFAIFNSNIPIQHSLFYHWTTELTNRSTFRLQNRDKEYVWDRKIKAKRCEYMDLTGNSYFARIYIFQRLFVPDREKKIMLGST